METTLIENLKKVLSDTFIILMVSKFKKAFSWKYKGVLFYVILSIFQMSHT